MLPGTVGPQVAVYIANRVQGLSIPWEEDSWCLPTKGLHTGSGRGKDAKLSSASNSDVAPLWCPMHPSFRASTAEGHLASVAEIGVLPKAPAPFLLLLLPVNYLLDCDHFLPEFFYSVEVSALPPGAFRFRRLFDLEPWAFLFFITVGAVLSSSSHIRVI